MSEVSEWARGASSASERTSEWPSTYDSHLDPPDSNLGLLDSHPTTASMMQLTSCSSTLYQKMPRIWCQYLSYVPFAYSALKKHFHCFNCRYLQQLHWSSWRAVPAHLGFWMHGKWCLYYCYIVYVAVAYSVYKKKADLYWINCRYQLQLHWSCWRAVPAHLE